MLRPSRTVLLLVFSICIGVPEAKSSPQEVVQHDEEEQQEQQSQPQAQAPVQEKEQAQPQLPVQDSIKRGYALIRAGRTDDAISLFDQLIAQSPDNTAAYNGKAVALDHSGNHAAAQKLYERALTIAPNSVPIRNNLAMSFILNQQVDDAISLLEALNMQYGNNKTVRQNLALAYGIKGNYKKALELNMQDLPPEQAKENVEFYKEYARRLKEGNAAKQMGFAPTTAATVAESKPDQKPDNATVADTTARKNARPVDTAQTPTKPDQKAGNATATDTAVRQKVKATDTAQAVPKASQTTDAATALDSAIKMDSKPQNTVRNMQVFSGPLNTAQKDTQPVDAPPPSAELPKVPVSPLSTNAVADKPAAALPLPADQPAVPVQATVKMAPSAEGIPQVKAGPTVSLGTNTDADAKPPVALQATPLPPTPDNSEAVKPQSKLQASPPAPAAPAGAVAGKDTRVPEIMPLAMNIPAVLPRVTGSTGINRLATATTTPPMLPKLPEPAPAVTVAQKNAKPEKPASAPVKIAANVKTRKFKPLPATPAPLIPIEIVTNMSLKPPAVLKFTPRPIKIARADRLDKLVPLAGSEPLPAKRYNPPSASGQDDDLKTDASAYPTVHHSIMY